MKYCKLAIFMLTGIMGYSQSVGINNPTPDPSAQLDISSTTKGLLIPRVTAAQRQSIPNPANGLMVYQTDGGGGIYYNAGSSFNPIWTAAGVNSWTVGGNSLLATGAFGTTSNNHIDLITNNQIRGRLSNLGEFFIGTTNTVVPGDLMNSVANATFPFAVNGYTSFNGAGVYGAVQGGNGAFAGVQGEYQNNTPGIFSTAGVKGVNQSSTPGTGFRTVAATGPRVGVIGNTTVSNGQYTFGLHGTMGSTDIRCGGVFGDDFGLAFGALAYFAANLADYSVYGFGNAFQVGVAGGRSSAPAEPNTQIGLGIYGGVMGGWVRGLVYGAHVKGERYGLYVDGPAYTNAPLAELVSRPDGSRVAAYPLSSLQPEVIARGKAVLTNGRMQVQFDAAFADIARSNPGDVTITVSPLGASKGLYIAAQDARGFTVAENENGSGTVQFSWIAIASRRGTEQLAPSPELLTTEFDRKMNGVMFNDNNRTDRPQPLWWDGQQVRFDNPPPKQPDAQYRTGARQKPGQ